MALNGRTEAAAGRDLPDSAWAAFADGGAELAQVLLGGGSLQDGLARVCRRLDRELVGFDARAAVCQVRDGCVCWLAGPGLPASLWHAVQDVPLGENAGACGRAVQACEPVFVADVLADPSYALFREVLRPLGIRSAWSRPVFAEDGTVVATVVLHFLRRRSAPPAAAEALVRRFAALVRMAFALQAGAERADGEFTGLQRRMQESAIGCIEWGPDFRIRRSNPAAAALFRYPPDRLVGMAAEDFLLREADRRGLTTIKEDLLAGGARHTHARSRSRRSDGVPIWCEWFNLVLTDHDDRITGFLSLVQDVTESAFMRRYMERMVPPAASAGGWHHLDRMVEQIRRVVGADLALLASPEADGQHARVLAASSQDGSPLPERYALADTPCRHITREDDDACVINDQVQGLYPEDAILVALDARSYAGVRLRDRDGRTLAHLAVVGRTPLGPVAAVRRTLEHAGVRVRLELQRLWAERETRLAALAFETHEPSVILDRDYRIVRVNAAFATATGYAAGAVEGRSVRLLLGGHAGAGSRRMIEAGVARDGQWHGDLRVRERGGGFRWYRISVTALPEADERDAHYVGSFLDVTWHREAEERIQRLTFEDAVTGLPNRAALLERLARGADAASGSPVRGLFLVDLDGFRRVHDGLGHETANSLLEVQAARLRSLVPASAFVARVGSDEFAVVLYAESVDGEGTAVGLDAEAEGIRRAFAEPVEVAGAMVQSGVSIGVAAMDPDLRDASALLSRGEIAVTRARTPGGNRVARFARAMEAEAGARLALERGLREAVAGAGLGFHVQPIVDAGGGVDTLEVLARWEMDGRMVPPAEFIPVAEASGLIRPLGARILRDACCWLAALGRARPDARRPALAINVSVHQFHDPDFEAVVARALEESGLPAGSLVLELTESLLAEEGDAVIGRMQRLRARGVRFAIDDFGIGYSCLAYLRRLPIDQLKIDGSFVDAMLLRPEDDEIVGTVIAMARALRLDVVAERVETPAQAERLRALGCPKLQGFLFHRPLTPDAAAALLADGEAGGGEARAE